MTQVRQAAVRPDVVFMAIPVEDGKLCPEHQALILTRAVPVRDNPAMLNLATEWYWSREAGELWPDPRSFIRSRLAREPG